MDYKIIKIKVKKNKNEEPKPKKQKELTQEEQILEKGLLEEYDINKLYYLLQNNNLKEIIDKRNYTEEQAEKELKKHKHFINTLILNNGKITTNYFYNNDKIKFRKFSKTTSTQSIIRELRNFLMTDYKDYKDIDFVNCISSIMLFITKTLNIKTPMISLYHSEREMIINKYYEGKKEQVKNFINTSFFNSNNETQTTPKNNFEKEILKEIKSIHNNLNPQYLEDIKGINGSHFLKVLLLCREQAKKSENVEKIKFLKNNKKIIDNLEGKILCNLYHYYENKALIVLTKYLFKQYKKYPHSLIFDGLIFNEKDIKPSEINEYFECLSVNTNYEFLKHLKVDIKPFTFNNEQNNYIKNVDTKEILKYQETFLKTDDKTKIIYDELINKYKFTQTETHKILNGLINQKKVSIKKFNNGYNINFKSGFITNENTKEAFNLLINYYENQTEEEELKKELVKDYETAEDVKKEALKFIKKDDEKIFIVKAPCGTGKTHIIINEVLKLYNPKHNKILYLTENNILNIKFTAEHKHFISHTDTEKDISDYNFNSCSIQSIIKVFTKKYDLLIIDEIDSVLNSISNNITFINSSSSLECFKMLSLLLAKTPKIILLDQDIEKRKVNLIEDILKKKNNSLIIHKLNLNAFYDVKTTIHTNKKDFENEIFNDLKNNKKLSIPTASKTYGEVLTNKILRSEELLNKNILFLHANKAEDDGKTDIYIKNKYHTNEKIKEDIKNNYKKLNIEEEHLKLPLDTIFLIYMSDIIKFYDIDIFIFTPSLKTGTSLNNPYFNKIYCYTDKRSIIPKQIIQMILRSRQIIDKEILFYTPHFYYNKINLNEFTEETEKFNIKKIELNKEINETAELIKIKIDKTEININYEKLQDIINYESYKKNTFYIYELINTLRKNGYKEPTFIYFNINDTAEAKEAKQDPQEDKLNEWLNYELLDEKEYNIIKNKEKNERTEREQGRYEKTANIKKCLDFNTYKNEEDLKKDLNKANNKEFYNKFMNDKALLKIKFIKEVIKYQLEDKQTQEYKINKIQKDESKNEVMKKILILETFKINLMNFKTIILTNKEFNKLFKINTKEEFKKTYNHLRKELKELDILISYISKKNTTQETAKIKIQQMAEKADEIEEVKKRGEKSDLRVLTLNGENFESPGEFLLNNELKNIHFYYSTAPEEKEEETDEDKKLWIDILESGNNKTNYKIINKNDKNYFYKRITTKDQNGKQQDRILKFEVYKNDDGKYTANKKKIDYNKENIMFVSYTDEDNNNTETTPEDLLNF